MSTMLEIARYELAHFIPRSDDALRAKFDALFEEVKVANIDNIEAFIPLTFRTQNDTNVGELDVFEDYEIESGKRTDEWDNEWRSKDEYEEFLKKLAEAKYTIRTVWWASIDGDDIDFDFDSEDAAWTYLRNYAAVEDIVLVNAGVRVCYLVEETDDDDLNEKPEDIERSEVERFDSESDAENDVEERRSAWAEEKLEEFDGLEMEYDEVYWNTVWNYDRGELYDDLAIRLGFGVLKITNEKHENEGESFMFLRGCGMDMSPDIMAYEALAFGAIRKEFTHHLRDRSKRDYAKYVMGSDIYQEVMDKLGLSRWIELDKIEAEAEAAERARIERVKEALEVRWIDDQAYGRHEVYVPGAFRAGDTVLMMAEDKVVGVRPDGTGRAKKMVIEECTDNQTVTFHRMPGQWPTDALRKIFEASEHPTMYGKVEYISKTGLSAGESTPIILYIEEGNMFVYSEMTGAAVNVRWVEEGKSVESITE